MKKRNFFVVKFAVVTVMIGLFSPSVTVEQVPANSRTVFSMPAMTTSGLSISLFTQAEARRGRGRGHRRGNRKAHRRANYRHHKKRNRRSNRRRARRVVGGVAAAAVVGTAVSHATRPRCEVVYVRGLRYEDCGNGLRPF